MKRILICLAFGLATIAAVPASAQAAGWTSCGPVPAIDGSTTHVWVTDGECDKAVGVVRASYKRYEEFFESIGENPDGGGSLSTSIGPFACDFDPGASSVVLRCENDPMIILGLKQAGRDPNKWTKPPAVTRTLRRNGAERMVKSSLIQDSDGGRVKEKLRVSCPKRLSRLSFRCHFSWFEAKVLHVRGTARIKKVLHGSSTSYTYRYYDRECLKAGGTLRKCQLQENRSREIHSSLRSA